MVSTGSIGCIHEELRSKSSGRARKGFYSRSVAKPKKILLGKGNVDVGAEAESGRQQQAS